MQTLEEGKAIWREKFVAVNLNWQTPPQNRHLSDQV